MAADDNNIEALFEIYAQGTTWGSILGDINNQPDLVAALDLKSDKTAVAEQIKTVTDLINLTSETLDNKINSVQSSLAGDISVLSETVESYNTATNGRIDLLSQTVSANDTAINNKVDGINTTLTNSINSLSDTVTSNYNTLDARITTNTENITTINSKIPNQASSSNQLADKDFVNSSISTNTANFIGTFNSVAELEAYTGPLTNNDYAFVSTTDSSGNTLYDRYKYNAATQEWIFEYELNNSSFTAAQWASINSGITNTLTGQITINQNSITNIQNSYVPNSRTINGKALSSNITLGASDVGALPTSTTINNLTTITQQNALNSGATSAKISQIATNTNNISTINDKIPADASSSNKLVTESSLSNAVVDLADQDLNNLTAAGNNRLHALKGYLDNGELLTDAEGLADVVNYAHSTFDLSKFTVTGTPTITDDGIARGFVSQTNFLNATYTSTTPTTSVDIWTKVIITDTTETSGVYCAIDGNLRLVRNSATAIGLRGFSGALSCEVTGLSLALNDEVIIHANVTGTNATVDVWINGVKSSNSVTHSNTIESAYSHLVVGGQYSNGNYSPLNSIDLKYQRVLFDGVEVFSGNKTGLDVIKPDDYTVVGTPTISADGIASGFVSQTNYITGSFVPVSATNKVELWGAIINNFADTNSSIICATNGNLRITKTSASVIGIRGLLGGLTVTSPNLSLQDGDFVIAHAIVTTTDATLQTWVNGVKQTDVTVSGDFSAVATAYDSLYIGGQYNNGNYSPASSIDINYCKVLIDGNLVYQPCLKIPYTKSKTGSKIADVSVRPRVTDMYEQFGYAPYYTLDEANGNFTLPQGEIYGMMLNQSVPHIIETYQNGMSGYIVYSNGYCEQWGRGVTDNDGWCAVSLLKEYRDTNYIPIANECHGSDETPSFQYADIVATDNMVTNAFRVLCSTDADTPADANSGIAWITRGYINL